jgi:3-oxoadipate enol-lactonase
VVRYDLRGHGRSVPPPDPPYSISDLGSDILSLLDELAIERAWLCGISIGAMASMWVAAHAPARVSGLMLCCTSARLSEDARRRYRERAAAVQRDGVQAIADAILAGWFTDRFARARPEVVARAREWLEQTSRVGYAGCCHALAAMDLVPELARIRVPTLVVAGAEDSATPMEHAELIARCIAGARLVALDAAHLAVVERSAEVSELFTKFLEENLE